MTACWINGIAHTVDDDPRLIDYLRDTLRLTSVKDGCSAGACGACTVLCDGKKTKACVSKVSRFAGCHLLTVEGLSTRERAVYTYAFAEAGAVQCGYCIPGMVLSAKALLDENKTPSRSQIKQAIAGNICRCTGYQKIEDAILLAALWFREEREIPAARERGQIGEHLQRIDAAEKVNGTGCFTDDIVLPGMIYAKALRSRYPRARIVKIDVEQARKHPDT
ncbi:MAG: 2Fe-2S iron-sulfur cluster-binding protein, partial [Clostridia bacterium]